MVERRSRTTRSRTSANHYARRSRVAEGPCAPDVASDLVRRVELMGIEPTTPCLQSRCSNHLSYSPGHDQGSGIAAGQAVGEAGAGAVMVAETSALSSTWW
jgi:hypothetical protein